MLAARHGAIMNSTDPEWIQIWLILFVILFLILSVMP
ncbi:hypothetical protein PBR31_00006 [Xanthomonas phage PBR31]|uniref:Uncharacterized protein n=1 Tax=Xanthomonas phage PPDBI TaxID=2723911 RepID=A0A6H0X5N3_9CAUD|nr:hypothetical protein PBR31_00006 [Xanthomonas phage PBR31]QIW89365.1 hypothetical protein PPDBI_00006 [Xanthomonas phage PPDBI]